MHAHFDLLLPQDQAQALAMLADCVDAERVMPLAGGTNLIVDLRARRVAPATLVGLGKLDALRGIGATDGRVTCGPSTTVSDLLRHPAVARHAPSLTQSARLFGGQMVRNAATVAGNLCCGSPAADLVPPLLVLDAEVVLSGRDASRTVPLADFHTGYRQTARRPHELVTSISWPIPPTASANLFYKLARRKGDAITVVGVAVALRAESGRCRGARIALGAVAPVAKRAGAAEALLEGQPLSEALIDAAACQATREASPIDDVRASAEYRRHALRVLTRRLLTQAWEQVA